MKIGNRAGHTSASPGASKRLFENTVVREVLAELNPLLSRHNQVVSCMPNEGVSYPAEISYGVRQANDNNVDYFFSLHANTAYNDYNGAIGSEVLTHSTDAKGREIGNRICGNLNKLGFKNRGVKNGDDFSECCSIKAPSNIIELFFLEASDDVNLYNKLGAKRIAHAIANAIDSRVSFEPDNNNSNGGIIVNKTGIEYQGHIENKGWEPVKKNGQTSGTTGENKRLESFVINYFGEGRIKYQGHIQNYGWTGVRENGEVLGTVGMSLRMEALKIWVEGSNQKIQYRVHIENKGWSHWRNNGEVAGTTGEKLRIEAIEIKMV